LQQWFGSLSSPYFIRGAFFAGLFLMAGAIAVLGYWRSRHTLYAVLALGLSFVLVNYMLVLVALPYFERFKPVAPLSASALSRNPAAHVVQFRTPLPSMVWYLGKPVEVVYDLPVLRERFNRPEETLVLLKAVDYSEVQALAPTCVVDRKHLLDVKLREIIGHSALPEMLLISNRCP
jgi:hypothetical protein